MTRWLPVRTLIRVTGELRGVGGAYLDPQQGAHTRLGRVADGREVVTPLQRHHHAAPGQRHQLTGQEAETYTHTRAHTHTQTSAHTHTHTHTHTHIG